MIILGPEGLKLSTVFLPAKPTHTDPMGQRSYLAIKFEGGLSVDSSTEAGLIELRDHIARQVEAALREALKRPDETVFSMAASC